MSEALTLADINMRWALAIEQTVLTGLHGTGAPYRVFKLTETGGLIVLRGIEKTNEGECVYGPASFGDCLAWVNGNFVLRPLP
jgi:hypothetical protein